MRRALADVVRAATARVTLRLGDKVLDVGSNDGTLLRCYPETLCRVGVEPATNLATRENYEDHNIGCIRDFWSLPPDHDESPHKFKIITACGMLYDLEDPAAFLRATAAALAPDGVFVAQLQCLAQTVRLRKTSATCATSTWSSTRCGRLGSLMVRAGLAVEDVEENDVNGGSYRLYCRKRTGRVPGGRDRAGADASTRPWRSTTPA
jgi:NDP-4-keto-2,6-dideoxyhexose 3-C-methyltransferase